MVKLLAVAILFGFLLIPNFSQAQTTEVEYCWMFDGFADVICVQASQPDANVRFYHLGDSFWFGGASYTLQGGGVGEINADLTVGKIAVRFENSTAFFGGKDICFLDAQFNPFNQVGVFQFNCVIGPGSTFEKTGLFLPTAPPSSQAIMQLSKELPLAGKQ
jgi:hypothetical protein